MIKYLFFILVTLLSGCTTDFSGLEKPEESVYIRFSSSPNIQIDVEVATRSGNDNTTGILGIATYSDEEMKETTLAGYKKETLRQWMANDKYYYTSSNFREDKIVEFVHQYGERPTFPIDKGSGMVVYAYKPHTECVEYGEDDCYIPLDLVADSASTDWMYSGREAMSKAAYRDVETFTLNSFKHAMTRLDVVLTPALSKWNPSFTIIEISLGVKNNVQGRFSIIDGSITVENKDESSYIDGICELERMIGRELSIYSNVEEHTESFYLIPGTEIASLYIKGVWSDGRVVDEERLIEMNGIKLEAGKSTALPVKLTNNY